MRPLTFNPSLATNHQPLATPPSLANRHQPLATILLAVLILLPSALSAQPPYFQLRDGLTNSLARFQKDQQGRVAFLGGSITHMAGGWRSMTCRMIQERFPRTKFDFIDAGLSSTDSTLAPFRLVNDVFAHGRVDLLFVEFAVNDRTNGRNDKDRIRGMEGIVRQARRLNPAVDIVFLYCVDPDKMADFRAGRTPQEIASHERVARHYGIPSLDLAREVTERIQAGEFTWADFGGLHPSPFGHRVYADSIRRLFAAAWPGRLAGEIAVQPRSLPEPLDAKNYEQGRYVSLDDALIVSGWQRVPSWNPKTQSTPHAPRDVAAATRPEFTGIPMLVADQPGAILKLYFKGTAVGMLVVAGPDVGILEYSINGQPFRELDQFTQWSPKLHIPWAYLLEADLPHGDHELVLRTTANKNRSSRGYAARIVKFLVD